MCDRDPLLLAEYASISEMLPNFFSVGARVPNDDYRRGLRPGAKSLFLVLTVALTFSLVHVVNATPFRHYRPFNIVGKLQIGTFNINVCTLI
ncbi:hypothetical protein LSAT2_013304 [Lamellibrachia satsuma]|nr:hypothetical protein LSAT2_013304 [Lamellibrachia satsuma]